jgi:hypothetical protein
MALAPRTPAFVRSQYIMTYCARVRCFIVHVLFEYLNAVLALFPAYWFIIRGYH